MHSTASATRIARSRSTRNRSQAATTSIGLILLPPPIVVPETGRVLPNLPMIGSGPGGAETSQDRATRCAHQSGVYGEAAGNRNAYIGSCINQ